MKDKCGIVNESLEYEEDGHGQGEEEEEDGKPQPRTVSFESDQAAQDQYLDDVLLEAFEVSAAPAVAAASNKLSKKRVAAAANEPSTKKMKQTTPWQDG